jgi:hypothetical protein
VRINPRLSLRQALSLFVAAGILAASLACNGTSQVRAVADKAAALIPIVQSFDPVAQLEAEGVITGEEAAHARAVVGGWTGPALSWAQSVKAALDANPKATLLDLAPAFADVLSKWNEVGSLKFADARAQDLFTKALGAARVILAFVAAFYAAKILSARSFLKRKPNALIDRTLLALAGYSYDKRKLARARSGSEPDAIASYTGILVSDSQIGALLRGA